MDTRERGSVLLMTLFLVMVIGLVGRAVILLGPGALALSTSSMERLEAQRAAESGLEYAMAKLRDNPQWRGNDNRVTVDVPGMVVVEDQGNVIGLVTDSAGRVSQFRFRFNYQDGNPGADGLPDPGGANELDSIFVSVNNLTETAEAVVPRAEEGSWQVTAPQQGPYSVPGGAACVIVEGRAGRGLSQHAALQPNAPLAGPTTRHVAEVYFQFGLNEPAGEASMMGGGDIRFQVPTGGKVRVEVKNGEGVVPRLRSKGVVSVDAGGAPGTLQIEEGEISRDVNKPPGFVADVQGSATLVQESVGDGKDFFNLKWEDVEKADSDPATSKAIHLPGGVYVHWDDGSTHYYDMPLSDYQAYMADPGNQNDPGVELSQDCREIRDTVNLSANPTGITVKGNYSSYSNRWTGCDWRVEKDLYIGGSSNGVSEFVIMPRSGASFSPNDDTDLIPLANPDKFDNSDIKFKMRDATISADDDIVLMTQIEGENSTITSAGSLKLITGETKLKQDDDGGDKDDKGGGLFAKSLQLNLYVKEDILASTYRGGEKFEELKLEGLVYSWGNFTALLGDPILDRWDRFQLKGALVAYGADPNSGSPGSAGSGNIDIMAKEARIEWDDRKMAGALPVGSSTVTLRRTLYNTY